MRRSKLPAVLVILMLTGAAIPADTEKQPEAEPQEEKSVVFTNDDLLERYGEPEPAPPTADKAKPEGDAPKTPLERLKQQQLDQAAQKQTVAEAEKSLADAQKRLAQLEKQLTATRNPYAARVELSEEEKAIRRDSNEGARERMLRSEKLVKEARVQVAEAEKALAEARKGV